MNVVSLEGLKAHYINELYGAIKTTRAVDNVSLDIRPNEILGIAGESGCGKTTLLKILSSTIKPPLKIVQGKAAFHFDGKEIEFGDEAKLDEHRWRTIAYIPQGSMHVLNPVRKIRHTFHDFLEHHVDIDRKELDRRITDYLQQLGLSAKVLNSYPHELSGGMKQRVIIGLATYLRPKLILCDEPTTALDVMVQRNIVQLLRRIQKEQGNTIVLVSHDLGLHANITDRIAIMYAGKLVEIASTKQIFDRPLHPYTRLLINSLPSLDGTNELTGLSGQPPVLSDPPPGCRLHPRCPYVETRCRTEEPPLRTFGDRTAACFRISDGGECEY